VKKIVVPLCNIFSPSFLKKSSFKNGGRNEGASFLSFAMGHKKIMGTVSDK